MSTYTLPVTTTGSNGSATGVATKSVPYPTIVKAIDLDYHGSAPATTDVTITCGGRTILAVANNATDGVYAVRVPVSDNAGAPIADQYGEPLIRGAVTVTVGGSNALDPAVVVRLLTE